MTGSGRSGTGNRRYRRNVQVMLAVNDTCGICGHPGSLTGDHIVPARLWPRGGDGKPMPGLDDPANLRPAHGTMGSGRGRLHNPCPTCGRLCNQSRGARVARRPNTQTWFPNGVPRS
jgi:5-methylcytosine-specific restriction endonuclease McrA